MTSIAIQDAFVLLLLEKGYEKTSMRDIANVAGVSVGSVYQYFPGKEAVAAMTVRTWVRKLSTALSSAVDEVVQAEGQRTLREITRLLAQTQVHTMLEGGGRWRVLSSIERRVSPQLVYNRLYQHNVNLFGKALTSAVDWPEGLHDARVAFCAYTVVDALVKQTLLVSAALPSADVMVEEVLLALDGYLHAVRQSNARRE
ncbi:AcrR family transcriptional regulator [Variovorax boronicumulans]|uniref:AcrR family transcriptional regulator n=1 Tax=Variovorax boronicumulans TaxID=436515 RepID=A0AAW8DNM3_9BURK|nr:TetR/AcrR family transcriptional regulator [Variovorax boronicumulans]MDP9875835.1 AcrR family transcriptional regulator [Variovorax boronicumulans]MDP9921118.1 AcrR family transcriptional regulator [Variovorax boronicumulans]